MESQTLLNDSFPCPGPSARMFEINPYSSPALGEAGTEPEPLLEQNVSGSFILPSKDVLSSSHVEENHLSLDEDFQPDHPTNMVDPMLLDASGITLQPFGRFCSICSINIAVGYMCLECQRAVLEGPEPDTPSVTNLPLAEDLVQNQHPISTSNAWEDASMDVIYLHGEKTGRLEDFEPYLPVNVTAAHNTYSTLLGSLLLSPEESMQFSSTEPAPCVDLVGSIRSITSPRARFCPYPVPVTVDTWLPGIGNQFVERDTPRAVQIEQLNELVLMGHENHVFDLNMEDARDRIPRRRRLTGEELRIRKEKRGRVCERCKKGKRRVSIPFVFLAVKATDSK